jgi:TusA-related sulfurtransferase
MLDLAPPTGLVPPRSAVDDVAAALGRVFVDAIVGGDFDRLETLLAPDVRFRAIIPDEYQEASTATGARAFVEDWFSGTDSRELLGSTVDLVGDRLALGYRLELTDAGERRIVEQHVAAAVDGALFCDLALVCSGFRPPAEDSANAVGRLGGNASPGEDHHAESPAFTPAAHLDATGLSCATLTPTVRSAVLGLDFGAVLEIVTDDPEAEESLRSWTRLTGNELVAAEAGPGSIRRFGIRRSPQRAATSTRKETD